VVSDFRLDSYMWPNFQPEIAKIYLSTNLPMLGDWFFMLFENIDIFQIVRGNIQ